MKLYRAETGQQVNWNSSVASQIQTLDDLKLEVERCTGVPAKSQILMTSFGTQVKPNHVRDVLKATGPEEYIIFCYDRHYLGALPEEISTLLDVEMPCLEPDIKPFDTTWQSKLPQLQSHTHSERCQAYVSLFKSFDTYSETLTKTMSVHVSLAKRIVDEQKSQSMALNVAMTNLESHNSSVNRGIRSFAELAERELARTMELVQAVDIDLEILRKIQIHDHILHATPQRKSRLVDYVDDTHILRAKGEAVELCDQLTPELHSLKAASKRLKRFERGLQAQITDNHDLQTLDSDLSDIQDLYQKTHILRDRIKRDLGRIYEKASDLLHIPLTTFLSSLSLEDLHDRSSSGDKAKNSHAPTPSVSSSQARRTIEAFHHLAETTQDDYITKQRQYETKVRSRVQDLIRRKRQSIERFLEHMNVVSQLQSEIAAVAPRLESANKDLSDFKQKHGPRDLEIASEVLFAYGTLMIEIVRRKEYAAMLRDNTTVMTGLLAQIHEREKDRRTHFRSTIESSLPFRFQDNGDLIPHCEISTVNMSQNESTLSRKDIIAFISMLGQYYTTNEGQQRQQGLFGARRLETERKLTVSHSTDLAASPLARSHTHKAIDRDTRGERFLELLNTMNQQLDGLRPELLKAIDTAFFDNLSDSARASVLSHRKLDHQLPTNDTATLPYNSKKTSTVSHLQGKIKTYESRIAFLENALHSAESVAANSDQRPSPTEHKQRPGSNVSSTYSVLDDGSDNNEDANKKPPTLARQGQPNDNDNRRIAIMLKEMEQLKATLQQQEDIISDLHNQIEQDHQKWTSQQGESEKSKIERDDMREKILELEQLLEEERQSFEDNRKSLLKEVQIKDNLADVRVANVEHDWRDKMASLQEELQVERDQNEQLQKEMQDLQRRHDKTVREKTDLQSEYTELQATAEKKQEELEKLLMDVNDSEQARNEIKERLSQAREMVERAEWDWNEKSDLIEKLSKKHDMIRRAVADMLSQYSDKVVPEDEDVEIVDMLSSFRQSLDAFAEQANQEHHQLASLEQDHAHITSRLESFEEEQEEWRALCVQMAYKVEYLRSQLLYEVATQLHLPIDEEEIGALTQKFLTNDNEANTVVWHGILQNMHRIDVPKFVDRIRKKVRDAHEMTHRWKKEYREIKDKYNKIASSSYEKIAFRNFKVGDVALFLPTRNSTGKPWAAFNIAAPHYFLSPSDAIANDMATHEWIVARITSITECIVDAENPETNPYGLAHGLCFYQLEAENWRNSRRGHKRARHHGDDPTSQQIPDADATLSQSSPSWSVSTAHQQASMAMSSVGDSYAASSPTKVERGLSSSLAMQTSSHDTLQS